MTTPHPSELALERHLLDPAASRVRAHVEGCDRCAARLAEMRRQGDEFLQFVFPATVEQVEQAAARGARRFSWFQLLAPLSAATAAAAVLLLVNPVSEQPPEGYAYGVKGEQGLGLSIFLQGGDGARVAREGEQVPAGAAIRFRVQPSRPCHLWILSVDAAGQVSRLFPTTGDGGALVATRFEVPGGAELDGKAGPERLFALCTPGPAWYATVERALQAATARGATAVRAIRVIPGLPDGTAQASLLLEKQ